MSDMSIMRLASSIALAFALAGVASAHAAGVATPAASTTAADMGGQVVMSNLAGGMADPVPLFASPSGPVLFVIGMPEAAEPAEAASHRAAPAKTLTTTHIGQR